MTTMHMVEVKVSNASLPGAYFTEHCQRVALTKDRVIGELLNNDSSWSSKSSIIQDGKWWYNNVVRISSYKMSYCSRNTEGWYLLPKHLTDVKGGKVESLVLCWCGQKSPASAVVPAVTSRGCLFTASGFRLSYFIQSSFIVIIILYGSPFLPTF